MTRTWKQRITIFAIATGSIILLVLLLRPASRDSTDHDPKGERPLPLADSTAVRHDSLQRIDNERRMNDYLTKHPAAVRDKYRRSN